jgi:protein involved in polysaccharide export with SLBB domain
MFTAATRKSTTLLGYCTALVGLAFTLQSCDTVGKPGVYTKADLDHVKMGSEAVKESMEIPTDELHQQDPNKPTKVPDQVSDDVPGAGDWEAVMRALYTIGPGDILEFRSFDDESLSRPQVTVRYDGKISLPFIPDVMVMDLSRDEATEVVRKAYQDVGFIDPLVSLVIQDASSKTYTVMGEVESQGEIPLVRRTSVLDAINAAGGPRINRAQGDTFVGAQGQLTAAFLIRKVGAKRQTYQLDLRDIERPGPHPAETLVMPNDIILVPEGVNLVYVIGEVSRPNVYAIRSRMGLVQLLAQAGGPIEATGRMSQVVLMRQLNDTDSEVSLIDLKELYRTGQDVLIEPGDVIYVPRKRLERLRTFVDQFTGSISPLLGLYTQALDAYYTKEFIDLARDAANNDTQLLDTLQGIGSIVDLIPPAGP